MSLPPDAKTTGHSCPDCGGPTRPAGGLNGSLRRIVCPACSLVITILHGPAGPWYVKQKTNGDLLRAAGPEH